MPSRVRKMLYTSREAKENSVLNTPTKGPGHQTEGTAGFAVAGTFLLIVGACLVFLLLADAADGLPIRMPGSWYTDRPIWVILACGSVAGGVALLYKSDGRASANRVTSEVPFGSVILYTRGSCPLCDEAKSVLKRFSGDLPEIEETVIDGNPELIQRFGECVPVVEIDGKVRFRGSVNEYLLQRLINGRRRQQKQTGR